MKSQHFINTITPLLRHLNVKPPSMVKDEQAIRIDFKNLQLQLAPLNDRELLFVVGMGTLPSNSAPSLPWKLLAANDISPTGPPISVALLEPNILILWARERYTQLNPTELIVLFERIVTKANDLTYLIGTEAQPHPAPVNTGDTVKLRTSFTTRQLRSIL